MIKRKLSAILCLLVMGFLSSCFHDAGVKYIDAAKAFNEFNLTKELKSQAQSESALFDSSLDSLELALNTFRGETSSEDYQRLAYRYQEMEKARRNRMEQLLTDSDTKIWIELNSYFESFGEQQGCNVLLGGTGNGNVLYIQESLNLTDDFIEYANKKYEGDE